MGSDSHTPGWRTCRAHDADAIGITHDIGVVLIADVYGNDREANARLIAAAPCMKEALEDLLDEIISHMRAEGWSSYEIEQRPYIIKARAILSKAGGQSK